MSSHRQVPPAAHLVDMLLDAVCMVDEQGTFVYVSAACERIFGYTQEELTGRQLLGLIHPEDLEATLEAAQRVRSGALVTNFENRYRRKDGSIAHIMWTARWSEHDQLRIAVARDITERKQHEAMQSAIYRISEAANSANDLDTLCIEMHPIVKQLLPFSLFSLTLHDASGGQAHFCYPASGSADIPATLAANIIADGRPHLLTKPEAGLQNPASWLGVPLVGKESAVGALVVYRPASMPVFSQEDRATLQYVSTQITSAIQRVQLQSKLHYLSHHDQLTGLPNRALLSDRLATAQRRAEREGSGIALLFLDLDSFKDINDSKGHAVGDLLLQEVARRLGSVVRAADTVARMGGDEFVLLLESIAHRDDACQVAEKVCTAFNTVFHLDGHDIRCSTSIGIAVNLNQVDAMGDLLKRADLAMYRAKEQGGSGYSLAE